MISTTHDNGRVTVTFSVAEIMAIKQWFSQHTGLAIDELRRLLPPELKPERDRNP